MSYFETSDKITWGLIFALFIATAIYCGCNDSVLDKDCDTNDNAGIIIHLDSTYGVWMPVNSGDTIGRFFMNRHANGDATFTIYGDTIMLRHKKTNQP